MKRALPLLAFALAGCATLAPASPGPTAALGQRAEVDGVRIRPLAIVEDSRCPMNARCVWAGRLIVQVEIEFNGGSEEFRGNLTLGEPLALGRETVTLVGAAPEKLAGAQTPARAYRFTFAVQRQP